MTGRGLIGIAAALMAAACGRGAAAELGRELFTGARPIPAHLAGDDLELPVQASRCANCHLTVAAATDAAAATGGAGTQTFGPPLTAASLTRSIPRRGGPPSRYDVDSFCKLLRTGLDPAQVLIQRAMPRYPLDDAQCRALWAHLVGRS